MALVLDASITLHWVLDEVQDDLSDTVLRAVLREGAHVPAIWSFEVAAVLSRAVRRQTMTRQIAAGFLAHLQTFEIERELPDPRTLLELSVQYLLTAYDAAYLHLAIRMGLPLATFDQELARAAESVGVPLVKVV